MKLRLWCWLLLLFIPPYMLVGLTTYWYVIDTTPPFAVVYQYPSFLSQPITDVKDAPKFAIETARPNQEVYMWRSVCLAKNAGVGQAQINWVEMRGAMAGGFSWSAPTRTMPPHEGCYSRSFMTTVPEFNGRTLEYRVTATYDNNPLKATRTVFPPLYIRIVDTEAREIAASTVTDAAKVASSIVDGAAKKAALLVAKSAKEAKDTIAAPEKNPRANPGRQ
jgi:hypothetical protein